MLCILLLLPNSKTAVISTSTCTKVVGELKKKQGDQNGKFKLKYRDYYYRVVPLLLVLLLMLVLIIIIILLLLQYCLRSRTLMSPIFQLHQPLRITFYKQYQLCTRSSTSSSGSISSPTSICNSFLWQYTTGSASNIIDCEGASAPNARVMLVVPLPVFEKHYPCIF